MKKQKQERRVFLCKSKKILLNIPECAEADVREAVRKITDEWCVDKDDILDVFELTVRCESHTNSVQKTVVITPKNVMWPEMYDVFSEEIAKFDNDNVEFELVQDEYLKDYPKWCTSIDAIVDYFHKTKQLPEQQKKSKNFKQ